MPAGRVEKKKKTKTPKEVPEPGDPERKRVLNVLAQRRYRRYFVVAILELYECVTVLTDASR